MTRSLTPKLSWRCLHFTITLFLLPIIHAQLGTLLQDLTTMALFASQKDCAQSCFIDTGPICTSDVIAVAIGCVPDNECRFKLAKNECYCRGDLQQPALDVLSRCVSRACSVGDPAVDMSTAGGLYRQYCSEKGYEMKGPATVGASTTTGTGAATRTAGGGFLDPTSSISDLNQPPTSSSKKRLSIIEIVGIGIGGFAGVVLISWTCKKLFGPGGWFRTDPNKHIPQQQPLVQQYPQYGQHPKYGQQPDYPSQHIQEPYYRSPPTSDVGITESEVHPDESASVISAPRVGPSLVSAAPAWIPPYNPGMPPHNQEHPPYHPGMPPHHQEPPPYQR